MSGNRFRRIIPKLNTLDAESMQSVVQHLAREQGFLETIFNTIAEAVIVIDDQEKILYHNTAAKNMLGMPDNLSRLTVGRLLPGVNWNALLPKHRAAGAKILRQELELMYPARRIVQCYALPLGDGDSKFAVILNDITATMDKAHSDAESERSRLVSMLAAGVAHEIGNPLNSLYLHLQYLQRLLSCDELDRASAQEETGEARHEVERLDSIITQFLHALRPGKPEFQPIDLKTVVLESLHFMRHEITAREIKVEFLWGDDIPLINGDAGQLKQAFYNLVRNAIQSMPAGGALGIHCAADENFVSLAVSDSGCGIGKDNLAKIFEAYFTTKQTGTGLGLMIVERIVREHGGSLSVDSEEGRGTTFTLSFPRRDRRIKVLPPPENDNTPELEAPAADGDGKGTHS